MFNNLSIKGLFVGIRAVEGLRLVVLVLVVQYTPKPKQQPTFDEEPLINKTSYEHIDHIGNNLQDIILFFLSSFLISWILAVFVWQLIYTFLKLGFLGISCCFYLLLANQRRFLEDFLKLYLDSTPKYLSFVLLSF